MTDVLQLARGVLADDASDETTRLLAQGVIALMEDAGKLVDLAKADAVRDLAKAAELQLRTEKQVRMFAHAADTEKAEAKHWRGLVKRVQPVYDAAVAWTKAECCADDDKRGTAGAHRLHTYGCPSFMAACAVSDAVAAIQPVRDLGPLQPSRVANLVDLLRPVIARLNADYHTTTEEYMGNIAKTLATAMEET